MNWIKKNRNLIVCWVIILLIAPFFIEILFFVDIMGAEVTVGFLALLYRDYKANYELRKYQIKQYASFVFRSIQNHPVCQVNIYCFHSVTSIVLFVVTGSLSFAILAWYPILSIGNKLAGHA